MFPHTQFPIDSGIAKYRATVLPAFGFILNVVDFLGVLGGSIIGLVFLGAWRIQAAVNGD